MALFCARSHPVALDTLHHLHGCFFSIFEQTGCTDNQSANEATEIFKLIGNKLEIVAEWLYSVG